MKYHVKIMPANVSFSVEENTNLMTLLRRESQPIEAPCGGKGSCRKCMVEIEGQDMLACQTFVDRDMTVQLKKRTSAEILMTDEYRRCSTDLENGEYALAFDIGTTTMVGYLLNHIGEQIAVASMLNPQSVYGADVVTRIQAAIAGESGNLTVAVRMAIESLTEQMCTKVHISTKKIKRVAVVANPCMHQLFFGIPVDNLAQIPFTPVLAKVDTIPAKEIIQGCPNAQLFIVPDISGYVGADTVGCILSTGMYENEKNILMVDIGTNGEMVLGNRNGMAACSTAAGPALEGANIQFGMRGAKGAVDHVWAENGKIYCHVIGEVKAAGICGSGLIDAAAVLLENGMINKRGRIRTVKGTEPFDEYIREKDGQRVVYLTEEIYLTQNDIREVQLAKGAIAAGILLMCEHMKVPVEEISEVLLAGAFGSYINPESACRIGLLPKELEGRIRAVGNAAGNGSKLMACSKEQLQKTEIFLRKTESLELASLPQFQHCFAQNMFF
ncbi:MAG: DUF4445 domain-containing protein [Lachnospiraceae bacterium]|nr:DUF4445 domain-containing protein [Lachnospiraceae bacterium]